MLPSSSEEWSRIASYSAVFSALVLAATLVSVATPVTRGYFNLGESMVYTAAILGGPLVGAIAGAIGSSLADIILGYGYYAPGTFIIKGLEGFIVGALFLRLSRVPRDRWARLLPWVSAGIGALFAGLSLVLYTGLLSGGWSVPTELSFWGKTVSFTVPWWVWPLLGLGVAIAVYVLGRRGPLLGAALVSMLVGGLWMVLGYFVYEATVIYSLGIGEMSSPLAAASEIPVNIGQAVVGASIASAIVGTVWRAGSGWPSSSAA
ncbi:MAG: ECF transporter S component [Desulfurococcales archaeon]|nr:ECF transporter S component [Desulfurococcales archaeon]